MGSSQLAWYEAELDNINVAVESLYPEEKVNEHKFQTIFL